MEATATRRDGGPGEQRHEQIGSAAGSYTVSSSSRSGTIVSSTAYTSGASRSSGLELIKIHGYEHLSWRWGERTKEEKMKRLIELANGGATSALNLNLNLKRWFTELSVAWVLDLPDDAVSALQLEVSRDFTRSFSGIIITRWIHAFAEIVETIRFMSTLPLPDPCSHTGDDEEQPVPNQFFLLMRVTTKILHRVKSKLFLTNDLIRDDGASIPDQIQFARFTQVAMLKMLAFVDVLVAVDHGAVLYGIPEIYKSLNLLLGMHDVLSKALHMIHVLFISSPPGEVESILFMIWRLLSTKEGKALDALCLTLNYTTTHLLKRIEDTSATQTLQQGSSDIHKVTLSVISHISFLMDNKFSLDLIVLEAYYRGKVYEDLIISQAHNRGKVYGTRIIGNQTHSDSMIIRMASRLQEKLASLSESFPDRRLILLFLLNNSHRLHQCLQSEIEPWWSSLQLYAESLVTKVDGYMQSYLQVSWAPVLSCLFNPTPHFLGKNYSPLTRFESAFREAYITQKQWKVPDPELRKKLRTAIIEQIIPGYTKCIEENNITTPRLAPQELEEMLQDLFEG